MKTFKQLQEALLEARATYCGKCGTTHVPESKGGDCPATAESAELGEEQKYYSLVHKATNKVLSTHKSLDSAKDEHQGLEQGVRAHYRIATSTKEPKAFNVKEDAKLDEMTQGKEYTHDQLKKKIQTGQWEATHDIKPGKHVEMRHHTGKKVTVYVKEGVELTESHFAVGDKVMCKASGKTGEVVKLDKEHGADDEKYYTVKLDGGKEMKYAPNELSLIKEEAELEESAKGHTIEAHGIKGMKGTPWRKTFKSHDHLNDWAEKNDSVEIHGTRDLEKTNYQKEDAEQIAEGDDYSVTVTHVKADKSSTKHDYHIRNANDPRHAKNIALNRHMDKFKTKPGEQIHAGSFETKKLAKEDVKLDEAQDVQMVDGKARVYVNHKNVVTPKEVAAAKSKLPAKAGKKWSFDTHGHDGERRYMEFAHMKEEVVAEAEKNPHTSALGKALYRALSKQPKLSPQQVQRNKERWAKRQAEREQGVAEEVEQIDELSVNKMMKYTDAAQKNRDELNKKWTAGTASQKEKEKVIGREDGEARASDKIKAKTGKRPDQLGKLAKLRYAITKEETISEAADQHKVVVTVSEPDHPMVSKRKETVMKRVVVSAPHKDHAVAKAKEFYKKRGYKVHDAEYHSAVPKSTLATEGFENLPGKATHILNKDIRHPEHGIVAGSTVLRHTGGDNYEVRAGRAKGKIIGIDKQHVKKLDESVELDEKTLTDAEMKKREEIAKAMERENPGMDMSKKMAIATAVAKRVAEENLEELSSDTIKSYTQKAMRDTIIGTKDRNKGMARAYSRVAGTNKPLLPSDK